MGWPPVQSFRKNSLQVKKTAANTAVPENNYVKVSMDGAPYLRKIDLGLYKGYPELLQTLEDMFKFTVGMYIHIYIEFDFFFFLSEISAKVLIFFFLIGEYSEREGYKGSEYVPTYEDKDGDWMLVGDVPWE